MNPIAILSTYFRYKIVHKIVLCRP